MLNLNETEEHEDDLNNIISSFNNRPIYNETILKEKYSFDDDYKLDEDEIFENNKKLFKKTLQTNTNMYAKLFCWKISDLEMDH